jgi:hypothetical protein
MPDFSNERRIAFGDLRFAPVPIRPVDFIAIGP